MTLFHEHDYAPDAFEVRVSELLVATADGGDALINDSVPEVLKLLREHLRMDVVFVSEFVDGRRVFRHVNTAPDRPSLIAANESAPLEQSFCQRVVDGRLPGLVQDVAKLPDFDQLPATPFPVGAHLSVPIVLNDGRVYGTLCCFSTGANPALAQRDLKKLEMSALLAARRIDADRTRETDKVTAAWSLEPQDDRSRAR
ncbi:MAG: GAF domain-containing protein [Variovorax sp.]|nr:MAG: GAF domain-containing protein [Variovorax sp.]